MRRLAYRAARIPFAFERAVGPFLLLWLALLCAACASGPSGELMLRPVPQRLPTVQAQGDLVIATLAGATITVEPLTAQGLDAYYARRPAFVNPLKLRLKGIEHPLVFLLRIRNTGRDRINFDPRQAMVVDQQGRRLAALSYDEMYGLFPERGASARVLRALEETVLTGYVVVPPKLDREGLLVFPPPDSATKTVILDVSSFYLGSVQQLLLFEFEVRRGP